MLENSHWGAQNDWIAIRPAHDILPSYLITNKETVGVNNDIDLIMQAKQTNRTLWES